MIFFFFFFQAEDGIRDRNVTGVQTCALPICDERLGQPPAGARFRGHACRGHVPNLGDGRDRSGLHHGPTPSRLARPELDAGAGAFAEPRTSIPLLGGEVHRALVFSGGPGEVSSPLRIFVPWYPSVHGSGLKKVSATPNRAPLLVITVDPAAIAAGRAENVSCSAAPRVRVISEMVSRFAISAPSVGVLSVIRPASWVAAGAPLANSQRRSASEATSCPANSRALAANDWNAAASSFWVRSTVWLSWISVSVCGSAAPAARTSLFCPSMSACRLVLVPPNPVASSLSTVRSSPSGTEVERSLTLVSRLVTGSGSWVSWRGITLPAVR